ncbi:MAG TPA: hypothetical protein PLD54_04500, partial [Candidatus Levybacteria bacterium]|nr:hypothetical protein [Candidatus Levybacteria bacterium]
MPTLHVSDDTNQTRPLFLVSGSLPHITRSFIATLTDDFKLIILNNPHKYPATENLFQVYTTALGTIKNLAEKLDYAVFFLNTTEDKKILEQLLPKLEKDTPRTIILLPVERFSDFSDILLATKHIPSVSFALIGNIFGSNIPPAVSQMSQLVYTALTQKTAGFIGNELVSVYPISKNDVLIGIPYLLFSKEKQERVFFFFYEHPQTIISAIHVLKRIEPDLQILPDAHPSEFPHLPAHRQIEQRITTKSQLKSTYLDEVFDGFEKSVRSVSYSSSIKPVRKRRRTRITKLATKKSFTQTTMTVLTCAVLLFFICNVLLTLAGVVFAKQAIESLKQGEFQKAGNQLAIAQQSFELSKPTVTLSFEILQKLPIPAITHSYQLFTSGVNLTSLAADQLAQLENTKTGVDHDTLLESLA